VTQFDFSIAYYTNPGKVRSKNEDSILVGQPLEHFFMTEPDNLNISGKETFILGVADGIGGGNAGEVASSFALNGMNALENFEISTVGSKLKDLNRAIYDVAQADSHRFGMGSTIAGMVFANGGALVYHVGDSRVYRIRDGYFQQLTKDDTFVQVLVDAGKLDPDAIRPENQHSLLQALGGRSEYTEITPHVRSCSLNSVDRFVVCTDGVTDFLELDELEAAVLPTLTVDECAKNLVKAASLTSQKDNISFILFDVFIN